MAHHSNSSRSSIHTKLHLNQTSLMLLLLLELLSVLLVLQMAATHPLLQQVAQNYHQQQQHQKAVVEHHQHGWKLQTYLLTLMCSAMQCCLWTNQRTGPHLMHAM
jgi:hypothetical protein